MRDDDYWALREDPDPFVPVADLTEEPVARPGRRRVPSRRIAAALLVIALAGAGWVVLAHVVNHGDHTRDRVGTGDQRATKTDGNVRARIAVQSALDTTTASGSFHIQYRLTADPTTPATPTTSAGSCGVSYSGTGALVVPRPDDVCGDVGSPNDVSISGDGVVHMNPSAMVTTANVPNLGLITTRVDGNDVWEDGGANYGMTPSTNTGPGSPLSLGSRVSCRARWVVARARSR